ncbi:hypothetical protein [Gordonia asplenii]|uniref:hypothetical protein n=1 Tax=Gordonia asplenii TaxID=2725283 RepID=UPI001B7D5C54|nr:hypothetical protein [Gordonia asplenii]
MNMTRSVSDHLVFRPSALAFGMSDAELRQTTGDSGELTKVAPGIYLPRDRGRVFPEDWHRAVAMAMASEQAYAATRAPMSERPVLSFQSAAAVHRLPMLSADFTYVHFTRRNSRNGSVRFRRHTHPGPLAEADITCVDGVAATTIERTAVDVACQSNFAGALTIFDSALRAGADRDEMAQLVLGSRRPGIAVARTTLPLASPLSANPGESWSRAQMLEAGLPDPVLQHEFIIEGQRFFVDFLLPGRLIGEFDGVAKYTKLMRDGEAPADVVIREKRREDLLRSLGYDMVRWVWRDLVRRAMVPRVTAKLGGRRWEDGSPPAPPMTPLPR